MNIESTLIRAIKKLKNFNISNPYLDSEVLLSKVINKDRKYIFLNNKKNLTNKFVNNYFKLIERRKDGEPVAYLTHKKDFWNHTFYVDKNVLIPRPDTELVIEEILKIFSKQKQLNVLDIGTGSGCILLSILKERPNFYGVGIDISNKSIKVSKYNAKMLQLKNKVKFYHSDVDNFKIGKYDLIVSNPPYINFPVLKYLDKDVVNFEPKIALDGGFDGISKIIDKRSHGGGIGFDREVVSKDNNIYNMPIFIYTAVTIDGKSKHGKIDAATKKQALSQLQSQSLYLPILI